MTTYAISIRQPYAELTLRGIKKAEYRSRPTNIRGRVYLYASKPRVNWPAGWRKVGKQPGELPTGVILGTVEIVGCRYRPSTDEFIYDLRDPIRFARKLKPKSQPNPCLWCPKF